MDLFDDFFIMMVQWSSSLLQPMLFLLVHHQILAQMLEHLEHFYTSNGIFVRRRIATWPKKTHTHTHTQCKSYKGRFGKLWPKVTIFERDKKTQFAIFKHVTKT
jgi:hypothetical protein